MSRECNEHRCAKIHGERENTHIENYDDAGCCTHTHTQNP